MNKAGTCEYASAKTIVVCIDLFFLGYKQRTHIAKLLKSRSQAIRTAVDRYNSAAVSLEPPQPCIKTTDVLEYAFLGQFDLLRDCKSTVLEQPWSREAERNAATVYFKLCRAREELQRLQVEAKRLAVFMHDFELEMQFQLDALMVADPSLAFQLRKRLDAYKTLHHVHRVRLLRLIRIDTLFANIGNGIAERSIYSCASSDEALGDVVNDPEASPEDSSDEDSGVEEMDEAIDILDGTID